MFNEIFKLSFYLSLQQSVEIFYMSGKVHQEVIFEHFCTALLHLKLFNWKYLEGIQFDEIFAVLDSENLIFQVVISVSVPDWPVPKINTLLLINVKATHVIAQPDTFYLLQFCLNILPCYSHREMYTGFLCLCCISFSHLLLEYSLVTSPPYVDLYFWTCVDLLYFIICKQMSLACKENFQYVRLPLF